MNDNEKLEVHLDGGSFAEEDWNEPEQNEVAEWIEPDKSMTIETRRGRRKKTKLKYNRYGDDFLIDKIQPDEIGADLVSMGDLTQVWQIIEDDADFWQEDHTVYENEKWTWNRAKQKRGSTRT